MTRKKARRPHSVPLEFIVSAALIAACIIVMSLPTRMLVRMWLLAAVFGVSIAFFLGRNWQEQRMQYVAAHLLAKHEDHLEKYGDAITIPTAICTPSGRIVWSNPAFYLLTQNESTGKSIFRLVPTMSKPETHNKITIGDSSYVKSIIPTSYNSKEYVIYRLIEVNRTLTMPHGRGSGIVAAAYVEIDNYEEIARSISQTSQSDLRSTVDRIVAEASDKQHALHLRYDRGKYLLVFDQRRLGQMIHSKFPMLRDVRSLDLGVPGLRATLSMGIGSGVNPEQSDQFAIKALEMALSRGGDQAVLKTMDGFSFFGGIQQGREKRTQVKARMFAKALRSLLEQSDRLIVMGHKTPDLDCMSSALGLLACARNVNKKAYIVLDRPNPAIDALIQEIRDNPIYKGVLISPAEASTMLDDRAVLAIVDTQIGSLTIAPQLLDEAVTTVVIDHHLRGTEYIEGPTLLLHEPYASSTAEMVTEIIRYFGDDVKLTPTTAEALLAGISVDTKGFSFKTGERTFEAASYLRRIGADATKIRHLFQDDLDVYTERARVVQGAQILSDGIAIAECPTDAKAPQLLAAQAADALLSIRGVEASFVLCQTGNETIISGRSLGEINVQRILEKLGGGGHATIAGAQLRDVNVKEARSMLLSKINEYEKEV